MDPDLVDYALEEGKENIAFHIEDGDILRKEAHTLLSIATTSALASLGFAAKLYSDFATKDQATLLELAFSMAGLSVYLFATAGFIVMGPLSVRDAAPSANEPSMLLHEKYSLEQIKRFNADILQKSIKAWRDRNKETGLKLKHARFTVFVSPLFFAGVWGVMHCALQS